MVLTRWPAQASGFFRTVVFDLIDSTPRGLDRKPVGRSECLSAHHNMCEGHCTFAKYSPSPLNFKSRTPV
jgi:hypothetical protein